MSNPLTSEKAINMSTHKVAFRSKVMTALFLGVLGYVPLWGQDLDFVPVKPDGPAKIQSALWELAVPSAGKLARAEGVEDTVVVILVPHRGQASASIDTSSMTALGVEVKARSKSLMRVSVPASSLLAVSELPGVSFVRRPFRPHAQQIRSEGRRFINAINNYNAGVRGQGVKVAVIDGGFKGANQLRSDMPATWWVLDYTGEGIYAGEDVHGTACAEIIYDVAPEAELTLLKVDDLVDLENAKDLCIRDGIDVINHSMSWYGTGIGDGRGLACDIVNDAADQGILWVNAAGNSANSHYDQSWSDNDSDRWHNFEGDDETLTFEVEKGTEISIYLTWNDWPETRDDYDLYLYFTNSSGNLDRVADTEDQGLNVQSGRRGHSPVEWIEYNAERKGEYHVAVSKKQAARSRRLKIWSFNRNLDFEYSTPEGSIGIPADARGSMSVGAVHFDEYDLGRIADYSSLGPTFDGRPKPELVAPSGVSTASYGETGVYYGYAGTSAAAPHVAGAAALIKSANPSYSRTQLWNALVAATVDVGSRGRDNTFGHGKLVLPVMQASRITSPQITSISPSRVRYNQVVTIRGTAFGANRGTSRVVFHSGKSPSSSQYVSWSNTQIQVRVPSGARTGNVQVVTSGGSDTARLTVTSPWISGVSPQTARSNAVVTVSGENFGSSRGSSSVRIGSVAITAFTSWSSRSIRFRVPRNTPPGNLTVRTAEGTSNSIRLNVTSPYLTSISPTSIKTGNRLTLAGGNFGSSRGTGYVLFGSVRASAADYVSWSDRRIVVNVPNRAQSGNVQVTTSNGTSGTKRLTIESRGPQISSISPSRVRYSQVITIRGTAFGANRGTSRVVFFGSGIASSSQYVSWSDTQIRVRVPSGTRTGDLQVVTSGGSDTVRLTVTSPWISGVSPQNARTNNVVTVNGENFGSSRGSSSVRIGSTAITSFTSWSSRAIRFRVPINTPPGNLTVRTTNGTSNSIRLNITSPYLTSISPTRAQPGDRLTLRGGNFGFTRGSGYVLFTALLPSAEDYVSWSDRRIVVRVPEQAPSGDVRVTTSNGTSEAKRLEIGSKSPQITSISPSRVRYNQVVTIRGTTFGANRDTSRVIFHGGKIPNASQYLLWSDTQIRVRVPAGARTGNVQVITTNGSDTFRLTITSPWISRVSPQTARSNSVVTVSGENFGSSRGSSSVQIGSTELTAFTSWTNGTIRFRIPRNTPPGNLTVRTAEGTSNFIRLEITSPYLTNISPTSVKTGDRLTLTGGNFWSRRGTGYVVFGSIRASAADYVSWSDRRIVVEVPDEAQSGNVQVATSNGTSGTKRLTVESKSLQITSISPSRVRYGQVITIRGRAFGANRGTSRVIFHGGKIPNASQYLLWSDTQIRVRVPAGARTGNVQVITTNGSDTFRLTITSPWISRVSPQTARSNSVVTVSGENFGSSRGSSSVQIGSTELTAFTSWTNGTIRFRIPRNTPPGNLTVRTAEGTSNSIRLNITSPYLTSISPTSVATGDRLTLTGGNFGSSRGTGYVLFFSSVRPSGADYVSWSDRRIVVEVPDEARSGNVQVATSNGTSGTKRLEIESEQLEPLPSRGLFGYSPPAVSKNPKSVKFGFDEGTNRDLYCYFSVKEISAGEVDIFLNEQRYTTLPASEDWTDWYLPLEKTDLRSGTDIIEFRNMSNQDRTSSFDRWQLKDVSVTSLRPANAKPVADTRFPSELLEELVSGLGDPFPAPFNAEVTIPFTVATASPVRLAVYNLMGQPIRVLADGWAEAGWHQVRWDGRTAAGAEAASGVYWAVLQAGDAVQTAKLALIR